MPRHVEIFTDGACRGNPGPGGWGAILRYKETEKMIKGAELATTNNRMELTAAIMALSTLKHSCKVDVTTDSQYVRNGIMTWIKKWKTNGWKTAGKKEVKNADLWQKLEESVEKHDITWHWVKGHSGHPENDQADLLANEAIDELMERIK